MNTNDNSLDDILNALSVSNIPTTPKSPDAGAIEVYDEKQALVKAMQGLDELIKNNADVMEEAKRLLNSTGDAEYFEVYANISKAQSEAFKNIVKMITEDKKNKILQSTKEREVAVKEKLADHTVGNSVGSGSGPSTLNQTNILMTGSREDMYNMILKMQESEKTKVIDMEPAKE